MLQWKHASITSRLILSGFSGGWYNRWIPLSIRSIMPSSILREYTSLLCTIHRDVVHFSQPTATIPFYIASHSVCFSYDYYTHATNICRISNRISSYSFTFSIYNSYAWQAWTFVKLETKRLAFSFLFLWTSRRIDWKW